MSFLKILNFIETSPCILTVEELIIYGHSVSDTLAGLHTLMHTLKHT